MKAICMNRLFVNNGDSFSIVMEGDIVDYTVNNGSFIINDTVLNSIAFFYHFKVTEGRDKMSYSDFEYILCNYIFITAVFFPNEYSGVRHLIIQNLTRSILITVNRTETAIRVSFENGQDTYSTYEEALDGIRNHVYDI